MTGDADGGTNTHPSCGLLSQGCTLDSVGGSSHHRLKVMDLRGTSAIDDEFFVFFGALLKSRFTALLVPAR
jgi:hypothetical protein